MTGGHEVAGSSPVAPITQAIENKKLTKSKPTEKLHKKENLASGLFLDSEIDEDLKLIIERWPEISVELRKAIVRILR